MADGIDVKIDDREVKQMIDGLIKKMDNPKPLLENVGRYIRALTLKMFRGRRPDNGNVRGERWPKLADSTIKAKKAAIKRGDAISGALRPLVYSGNLRDDLASKRALTIKGKGLEYGTDRKSKKGFPYPGVHQIDSGKIPQRRWLFLTRDELNQIASSTRDFLMGIKKNLSA